MSSLVCRKSCISYYLEKSLFRLYYNRTFFSCMSVAITWVYGCIFPYNDVFYSSHSSQVCNNIAVFA